jgi:hypothetical protein
MTRFAILLLAILTAATAGRPTPPTGDPFPE